MNQGSSTSYAVSGETTEWEDILIKKGITTKDNVLMGKGLNPLDFMDLEEETEEETDHVQSKLDGIQTLDDIDALEVSYWVITLLLLLQSLWC